MDRNLRTRLLTGTAYVLTLLLFFALKIFVHKLCFDLLILAFTVVGTYEMIRAFREKLHISQIVVITIFSVLIVTTYAISDFIFTDIYKITLPQDNPLEAVGRNYAPHITLVVFLAGLALLFGMMVFCHKNATLESTGYALIALIYPTVFLTILTVCNHLERYSDLALLLIFVISPFADSLAYVFGRAFGKNLPAKMAPSISPNKTLIGGFGGLVGGLIGGVVVFFFHSGICVPVALARSGEMSWAAAFTNINFPWMNLIFCAAIGIVVSAFSQFGDLVESAIKRNIGVKDMGKILPGHGGILDRIDSSLYACLCVALILVVRIMITG